MDGDLDPLTQARLDDVESRADILLTDLFTVRGADYYHDDKLTRAGELLEEVLTLIRTFGASVVPHKVT